MTDVPPVVWGSPTDFLISVPDTHEAAGLLPGGLVFVAEKCPFGRGFGGIGGSAFTSCSACGSMMSSTAGAPHDGVRVVPMVVMAVADLGDGLVGLELYWFQP